MNNTDFRHKLKNHKTNFNPIAWEQMRSIMDNVPSTYKKKNKRFWWIPLLFLISGIGYILNSNLYDAKENNSVLKMKTPINKGSTSFGYTFQKNIIIEKNIKTNKNIQKKGDESKVGASANSNIKKRKLFNDKKNNCEINQINSQAKVSKTINRKQFGNSTKNTLNLSISSNRDTSIQNNEGKTANFSINDFIRFDTLSVKSGRLSHYLNLKYTKPVKLRTQNYRAKLNKYFLTTKLGYAQFNGNSGLHFGIGFTYTLNKLLNFESELGYSYGADRNNKLNGVYQKEYQYEANVLAILNLITIKNLNFSFELGVGYTNYTGRRVLDTFIDNRKLRGMNIQGGLSLTYFTNSQYGIGIKWGEIDYDDGVSYWAIRLMRRL